MKSLLAVTSLLLALFSLAHADDETPAGRDVEAEVLAFLDRFDAAHTERDLDALRDLHVSDGRCRWYEDGQLRYADVDAIVEALAGFPEAMAVDTEYTEARVTPLGPRHAAVAARFSSSIAQGGRTVFAFDGVMTMVVEGQDDAWRVVSGHTSTRRPER